MVGLCVCLGTVLHFFKPRSVSILTRDPVGRVAYTSDRHLGTAPTHFGVGLVLLSTMAGCVCVCVLVSLSLQTVNDYRLDLQT